MCLHQLAYALDVILFYINKAADFYCCIPDATRHLYALYSRLSLPGKHVVPPQHYWHTLDGTSHFRLRDTFL